MRGGKREGAGRKGQGITKVYRLPIDLEPQIIELVRKHKKKAFDSVTKSKTSVNTRIPKPNNEQLRRLRIWLTLHEFTKSMTEARKITETPRKTRETVLKYFDLATEKYNWTIQDIGDLYK